MNKIPYKILNDFVFRTPIYPVNSTDYNKIINSPIFKEALYLASSELYNLTYTEEQISIENLTPKLRHSLLKYISRITSRCTPFGLFAGCGTGKIGTNSEITFKIANCKSKTRLDMSLLFSASQGSSKKTDSRNKVLFKPNDSLFRIYPVYFRYVEHRYSKNNRKYFLSEIDYEEYLDYILKAAESGCRAEDLVKLLITDGFTKEESLDYIEDLILNKILIPVNESFATSDDEPIDVIIARMQVLGDYKTQTRLSSIKNLLISLDNNPIGRGISCYQEIADRFQNEDRDFNAKYLLQSDLSIYGEKAFLSPQIYDIAMEGLVFLNKITGKTNISKLDKFRQDFFARYEDQEIPLLEALDVDMGIGFGEIDSREFNLNPLLKEIDIPQKSGTTTSVKSLSEILFDKYFFQDNTQIEEIEITDQDTLHLESNWDDLPNTLSSLIEVVKAGNKDSPPKIIMRTINGPSAANLMTRFCHANDEIYAIVKQIVDIENKNLPSDHVLAEIVHLPQSRLGNIIHRPILRNYELPYLTDSLKQKDETIDVSDILISVKNGQTIILRSKKLNKIILPILTSAHNFKVDSLPIYSFLCNLQFQEKRNYLSFRLPNNKEISYFPRVIYKNIILSPATWVFKKNETEKLGTWDLDEVKKYIEQKKLPQKVYICVADNKLYIDFNNQSLLLLFLSEAKNKTIILEEYLFDSEDMLIKNGNEIYTNQIILSFIKNVE